MQPTHNLVTDTVTPAVTLRAAATYLDRYGWIQGAYYDATAVVFTPAACMVGAIGMACYGGPVDVPAQMFDQPGFAEFEAASAWLDGFLSARYGVDTAYEFNDAKGRSATAVIFVLGEAANEWEAENSVPALAPGGYPVEQYDRARKPGLRHADYPHQPGTMYDCPACESACACVEGFQCVSCALAAEDDVCPSCESRQCYCFAVPLPCGCPADLFEDLGHRAGCPAGGDQ